MNIISRWVHRHMHRKIAAFISPRSHVLDLECGAGEIIQFLRSETYYVGVDHDRKQIQQCQLSFPQHQFLSFDIWNSIFPFRPHTFDIVIFHYRAKEGDNIRILLSEITRVMKQSAKVFVITPTYGYNTQVIQDLFKSVGLNVEHRDHFIFSPKSTFILKRGQIN